MSAGHRLQLLLCWTQLLGCAGLHLLHHQLLLVLLYLQQLHHVLLLLC
jgi:hypothetical protein